MNCCRAIVTLVAVLASVDCASSATILAPLFADHAVLQSGMAVPVWGTDDPGRSVCVQFADQNVTAVADNSGHWLVKFTALKPSSDGQDMTITGSSAVKISDVLVGEVWICGGQSNMEMQAGGVIGGTADIKAAGDPGIRQINVLAKPADEPQQSFDAKWIVGGPKTSGSFSAVGYFFARKLHDELHQPIGLIFNAAGGTRIQTWMPRATLEATTDGKADVDKYLKSISTYDPAADKVSFQAATRKWEELDKAYNALPADQQNPQNRPNKPHAPIAPRDNPQHPFGLYDARITPLIPFAIRGVIWYQGEANAGIYSAFAYRHQLADLIQGWRDAWGEGDFPFLFVQLANFDWGALTEGWPLLRDSQLTVLRSVPNTAMAVAVDVGDPRNIHARNKKPVGERLALAALHTAYGRDIVFSGPLFETATFTDGKAVLSFTSIGGGLQLKTSGGFEIAGSDKKFVPAIATIHGEQLEVTSPDVAAPIAVRYAWAPNPEASLYNKDGLPASPFRSDDWPVTRQPSAAVTRPAK